MWKDSGDSGHSGGEIFKQLTNANPNILEQCVKPAVLSTEQQPIEMMECNGKKILFVKKCQTMQESFERIGSAIEFTNSLGISSLSVPLLARHEVVRHHELVYKYWKSIVGGHKHSTAESTYVRAITVILARFSILLSKKEGSLKTFSLYLESEDNVDKAVKVLKILNKNAAYCLQPLGATVLQGNLADLFSGEKYSFEKLSVTSREFLQVKMDIRSTPPGRYQLKYIYKLHNKPLLLSYCATFTKMQRKFASETLFNQIKLEQTLYHGTKGLAVISIGDSGFDRSFSGANCECLGSGCYFAADLRYALGDTFSVPSTADTNCRTQSSNDASTKTQRTEASGHSPGEIQIRVLVESVGGPCLSRHEGHAPSADDFNWWHGSRLRRRQSEASGSVRRLQGREGLPRTSARICVI